MIIRKIEVYVIPSGVEPVYAWINSLDKFMASRIYKQIEKIKRGNMGDWKSLGGNLFEGRLTFGKGYRIYFSKMKDDTIVLLSGGDKSRQQKDIAQAREYLLDYKRRFQ